MKIDVSPYGVVHFSTKPTKQDRVGCDGIYVSRVVLSKKAKAAVRALVQHIKRKAKSP